MGQRCTHLYVQSAPGEFLPTEQFFYATEIPSKRFHIGEFRIVTWCPDGMMR
jgi:hypothetical protein